MNKGKVKFFNEIKGYGFITNSFTKQDDFVHKTDLPDGLTTLQPGSEVEYDLIEYKGKMSAKNLRF